MGAAASSRASLLLARVLPPSPARLDDVGPAQLAFPASLAAASSISPNRKFHRDDILSQFVTVDTRFGIRVGGGVEGGEAMGELGRDASRGGERSKALPFFFDATRTLSRNAPSRRTFRSTESAQRRGSVSEDAPRCEDAAFWWGLARNARRKNSKERGNLTQQDKKTQSVAAPVSCASREKIVRFFLPTFFFQTSTKRPNPPHHTRRGRKNRCILGRTRRTNACSRSFISFLLLLANGHGNGNETRRNKIKRRIKNERKSLSQRLSLARARARALGIPRHSSLSSFDSRREGARGG